MYGRLSHSLEMHLDHVNAGEESCNPCVTIVNASASPASDSNPEGGEISININCVHRFVHWLRLDHKNLSDSLN